MFGASETSLFPKTCAQSLSNGSDYKRFTKTWSIFAVQASALYVKVRRLKILTPNFNIQFRGDFVVSDDSSA